MPLVIATRESRLALWQAHHVQALLMQRLGLRAELLGMTTRGDQILDRALRPDLQIEPLRGNLDTRLRKLDEGAMDAIVLAAAGLVRLGLAARIRACFDPGQMLPAAGQGALALELRVDDAALHAALAPLAHRPTWLAVEAERAVSRALGGSCSLPLAAHATWQGDGTLALDALLGDVRQLDRPLLRARAAAPVADADAARALGGRVVAELRAHGADGYLPAA